MIVLIQWHLREICEFKHRVILDDTKKPASHVALVVKDPSVNAG